MLSARRIAAKDRISSPAVRRTIGIVHTLRLSRFCKNNMRLLALAVIFSVHALGAQAASRALADSVLADLSRLSDLERAYFAANGHYTDDVAALNFKATSGAVITAPGSVSFDFSAGTVWQQFLCFVIASVNDGSQPEKPFCTNSRYGTAAAALARVGTADDSIDTMQPAETSVVHAVAPPREARRSADKNATPSVESSGAISPRDFGLRLQAAARSIVDSEVVVVQFAVKDARYDPGRGVLEVAVERVALPPSADSTRPAVACRTQPAFACGASGLSYVARGLFRVPRSQAPSPETLKTGLTLRARFVIDRRSGGPRPAMTSPIGSRPHPDGPLVFAL